MLKLILIQRNGATTHRVLKDESIRYHDFVELVSYENFGQAIDKDESKSSIYVPHTDTTYTLLAIHEAKAC